MEALLPEWMPNIHPLIIHFPIVVWLLAVLFDFVSLFGLKKWTNTLPVALYILGALSALVAFLTGKQAIDMVSVPMQGEMTAGNHADWGHYTLYFFIVYAVVRFFIYWRQFDKHRIVAIILFLIGTIGIGFVAKTADLGGKLVYKYGVGVKK